MSALAMYPANCKDFWFSPRQLFDGNTLHTGLAIRVSNGILTELADCAKAHRSGIPVHCLDGTLCPGLFDIQVNGGASQMFNQHPDVESLRHIGNALQAAGTSAWLPTFITDLPERMELAALAIMQAHGQFGVVGVHFEGPHISMARRGAHKAAWIRAIDEHTFELMRRLRQRNIPVLLTLAPECQPAGSIARLCAMGVVVSLGHTAANEKQVRAALAEGATCFTHLFNGMTPLSSREPGVVGAALDSEVWCGFIADGHHVADTVLRLAIRARPRTDRMVLVSDAMATTHGSDQFDLYGETIQVVNGKLVNQAGSLAGAHIDLANSVRRLICSVGIPAEQVLQMATRNPAELMGLAQRIGQLRIGNQADLILFDTNWELQSMDGINSHTAKAIF